MESFDGGDLKEEILVLRSRRRCKDNIEMD